jgi:hypothetical protein
MHERSQERANVPEQTHMDHGGDGGRGGTGGRRVLVHVVVHDIIVHSGERGRGQLIE